MPPRYHDAPRISFGGPMTQAVKAIILVNVALFVLELFVLGLGGDEGWNTFLRTFALNPAEVFQRFKIWQLVTYMFLHSPQSIFHILFNMLVLWMFGSEIERVWGPARFTRYYLITGVGGGLLNAAFVWQSQVLGASGAIFGIIVAYAMMFPTRTILFWGIFPMTARAFALLIGGIELVSLGALSPDGVARFAHLGGALTGYLLMKGFWDPRRLISDLRWRLRRRRFKAIDPDDRRKDRFYPYH
jgi:membrane associated rhomboid family serine protease